MYNLFLDDERLPADVGWQVYDLNNRLVDLPELEWVVIRNFWEFKKVICGSGIPDVVTFDHDLGIPINENGMMCAELLANYCVSHNIEVPTSYFHTMNMIGKDNMISSLRSAKKVMA